MAPPSTTVVAIGVTALSALLILRRRELYRWWLSTWRGDDPESASTASLRIVKAEIIAVERDVKRAEADADALELELVKQQELLTKARARDAHVGCARTPPAAIVTPAASDTAMRAPVDPAPRRRPTAPRPPRGAGRALRPPRHRPRPGRVRTARPHRRRTTGRRARAGGRAPRRRVTISTLRTGASSKTSGTPTTPTPSSRGSDEATAAMRATRRRARREPPRDAPNVTHARGRARAARVRGARRARPRSARRRRGARAAPRARRARAGALPARGPRRRGRGAHERAGAAAARETRDGTVR